MIDLESGRSADAGLHVAGTAPGIEELAGLSDHDLLAGGLADRRTENRVAARRLARLYEFRRRRAASRAARKAEDPHFTLTPLRETVVEVSELWGLDSGTVAADVRLVRTLVNGLPLIWALCAQGRLEIYHARLIAEAVTAAHLSDDQRAVLDRLLAAWLTKSVSADPERCGLVNRTSRQLRNKLNYELKKLRPEDSEERFARAYASRKTKACAGEGDGMGSLVVGATVTDVQRTQHRLTLIAQALRGQGDARTLDQLRADVAIDLLLGRVAVDQAGNAETEVVDPITGELAIRRFPTCNAARPVINVTVPLTTVMGLGDDPGVSSGGEPVPAGLVRMVASDPECTWYRMLTDPAGKCAELSTVSYQPTEPIFRRVVAEAVSCYRANCQRPATECELDHKQPWPFGPTSTANLHPACRSDHRAKHAAGFGLDQQPDGSWSFHTPAGFTHRTGPADQPCMTGWPEPELFEVQFTASEFLATVARLRDEHAAVDAGIAAHYAEEKLWACYRASYPDATDEDIDAWVHAEPADHDDDAAPAAPPIIRTAPTVREYTLWERAAGLRPDFDNEDELLLV
jgi:hypothetical protein